jgi:Tfp pilus assembly PilM family ATPase
MSLAGVIERIRGFDLERAVGLRAAPPRVALELDRQAFTLVRVKPRRGGKPALEGLQLLPLEEPGVPGTLFDADPLPAEQLGAHFRQMFEGGGVRPGRVSLVLPDNLAKVALLPLPERPASRQQLVEIIRFKVHRAVPFRLSEASLSYQVLPGEGRGVTLLVALMRQALVERYEQALESVGARPGLVDLCTPNLLNLCRARIDAASAAGDVALLNCTQTYFSLMIVRQGRLIFYRCKTWTPGESGAERTNGVLARETASSFAYYQEKLGGQGIGTLLLRSVAAPCEELAGRLTQLGVASVEPIDPTAVVSPGNGMLLDSAIAQRIAPALGAAAGRS